ncbi:MAG: DNA primase, partial [Candidatus Cloacimonadia bacterium]
MGYDQKIIDDIRAANDIVQVIGEYIPLKRSGANYKALCPFHQEKTPSFMVSPSKQIFKCFGCGKGGNVFTFLMEYEKISFSEAIKRLASRVGITLPEREISPERQTLYIQLYDLYQSAHKYYRANLKKEEAALQYLYSRHLTDDTIHTFQLGLAPDQKNSLFNYLKKNGLDKSLALKSGLFTSRNDELIDKFQGRIIFPIFSVDGKVIAFGGRIYQNNDKWQAKYINSPETPIYQKRYHLFGLYQTKQEIIARDFAILVEGNTDLLKVYQHEFRNVVATLGTALTDNQIKLLARYTQNLYIMYDSDRAGIDAAVRAIKTCLENGVYPKIVLLPDDLDPDSFLDKFGKARLEEELQNARYFYDFIKEIYNADLNMENKTKAIEELIDDLSLIKSPVERQLYTQKVAEIFNISESNMLNEIKLPQPKYGRKPSGSPLPNLDQTLEEKELLKTILNMPESNTKLINALQEEYFSHPTYKKLVSLLKKYAKETSSTWEMNASQLLDSFTEEESGIVADILFTENQYTIGEAEKLLTALQIRKLDADLKRINSEIQNHPEDIEK